MNKIAIIGSGVMGRILAITLAEVYTELQIDIYDQNSSYKNSCSYSAGGMLSPLSELINCEKHTYEIGYNSFELWRNINSFINNNLNTTNSFVQEADTYIIAHNQDRHELDLAIRNINLRIDKLSKCLSQKARKDVNICEKSSLSSKEKGIYISRNINNNVIKLNEAFVDVASFFKLSDKFFKEYKNIKTFKISKERMYETHFDKKYKHIFDCIGFPNNQLNNLYGSRGEAVVVKAPNIKLNSIIKLLHPRHSIYLIPRVNDLFYIGATSIESQDYSEISVQGVLELLSSLMIIDKRFAEARIIKTLTNVRPVSKNDIPILYNIGKITYLNGLSRHGYLFAPALAKKAIQKFNIF